jgi:TPR repeat protein
MKLGQLLIGFLVGITVGVSTLPLFDFISDAYRLNNRPNEIQLAINDWKSGNSFKARNALEQRFSELNANEALLLANFYAAGEAGPVEEAKALAITRAVGCHHRPFGRAEFETSVQLLTIDQKRSLEWLIRSAEAGFAPAQLQLSKINRPELQEIANYWKNQIAARLPDDVDKQLSNCKD